MAREVYGLTIDFFIPKNIRSEDFIKWLKRQVHLKPIKSDEEYTLLRVLDTPRRHEIVLTEEEDTEYKEPGISS